MPALFKRRFTSTRPKPLPADHGGPLWDRPYSGKPSTPKNIVKDVGDSARDVIEDEPEAAFDRVKKRVGAYLERRGPDIRQPVPLTPNPWRRRRGE